MSTVQFINLRFNKNPWPLRIKWHKSVWTWGYTARKTGSTLTKPDRSENISSSTVKLWDSITNLQPKLISITTWISRQPDWSLSFSNNCTFLRSTEATIIIWFNSHMISWKIKLNKAQNVPIMSRQKWHSRHN